MRKSAAVLASVALISSISVAAPAPAEARGGFFPGLAGGLIASAIIGGIASEAYGYGAPYPYAAPYGYGPYRPYALGPYYRPYPIDYAPFGYDSYAPRYYQPYVERYTYDFPRYRYRYNRAPRYAYQPSRPHGLTYASFGAPRHGWRAGRHWHRGPHIAPHVYHVRHRY